MNIASYKTLIRIIYLYLVDEDYLLEKQCQAGTAVLNVAECKKACGLLGISRLGVFKEGRPCYKGGSGLCNQNLKRPGNKATRICKGIQMKNNGYLVYCKNRSIASSIRYFTIIIQAFKIQEDTLITLRIW